MLWVGRPTRGSLFGQLRGPCSSATSSCSLSWGSSPMRLVLLDSPLSPTFSCSYILLSSPPYLLLLPSQGQWLPGSGELPWIHHLPSPSCSYCSGGGAPDLRSMRLCPAAFPGAFAGTCLPASDRKEDVVTERRGIKGGEEVGHFFAFVSIWLGCTRLVSLLRLDGP